MMSIEALSSRMDCEFCDDGLELLFEADRGREPELYLGPFRCGDRDCCRDLKLPLLNSCEMGGLLYPSDRFDDCD